MPSARKDSGVKAYESRSARVEFGNGERADSSWRYNMRSLLLGAVSLTLFFTIACSDSSSPSSPTPTPTPPSGSSSTVSIPNGASFLTTTAFNPGVDDIAVGTTVTWTNNDSTAHTSTSDQPGW